MQVFYVMYNERKEEIEGFFKLMSFLEEKEMKKDDLNYVIEALQKQD